MDLGGLVYKRVWKITFFGLNRGRIWRNWRNPPTKNSQENPPPPPRGSKYSLSVHIGNIPVCFPTNLYL